MKYDKAARPSLLRKLRINIKGALNVSLNCHNTRLSYLPINVHGSRETKRKFFQAVSSNDLVSSYSNTINTLSKNE